MLADLIALFGAGVASFLAPCVVPLVPAYYTASAYPSLARIAARLDAMPGISARVISSSTSRKRALVASRTT